jgi:hypothetical protein
MKVLPTLNMIHKPVAKPPKSVFRTTAQVGELEKAVSQHTPITASPTWDAFMSVSAL